MSREKVTQNSRDLLLELKGLVAIENLTAFNNHDRQEKNVQIVIPKDVDGFKVFLSQNHEQIFRDYKALDDKRASSPAKSLYVATLKACGYLYAIGTGTGNEDLVTEIKGFAPNYSGEFNNIVAYSKVVTDVSQNMMRQKTLFQKLDKTKSYDVNTLSQIIKEARFVLQNKPELFHSHTIYQQAKKIDELAQKSKNTSVVAAYEAVKNEERLAVVTREVTEIQAKVDKALSSRFITQEEGPALIRELEQLVASQKEGQDPPGSGQGPPVESQQRNEQITLTKQQQGKKMTIQDIKNKIFPTGNVTDLITNEFTQENLAALNAFIVDNKEALSSVAGDGSKREATLSGYEQEIIVCRELLDMLKETVLDGIADPDLSKDIEGWKDLKAQAPKLLGQLTLASGGLAVGGGSGSVSRAEQVEQQEQELVSFLGTIPSKLDSDGKSNVLDRESEGLSAFVNGLSAKQDELQNLEAVYSVNEEQFLSTKLLVTLMQHINEVQTEVEPEWLAFAQQVSADYLSREQATGGRVESSNSRSTPPSAPLSYGEVLKSFTQAFSQDGTFIDFSKIQKSVMTSHSNLSQESKEEFLKQIKTQHSLAEGASAYDYLQAAGVLEESLIGKGKGAEKLYTQAEFGKIVETRKAFGTNVTKESNQADYLIKALSRYIYAAPEICGEVSLKATNFDNFATSIDHFIEQAKALSASDVGVTADQKDKLQLLTKTFDAVALEIEKERAAQQKRAAQRLTGQSLLSTRPPALSPTQDITYVASHICDKVRERGEADQLNGYLHKSGIQDLGQFQKLLKAIDTLENRDDISTTSEVGAQEQELYETDVIEAAKKLVTAVAIEKGFYQDLLDGTPVSLMSSLGVDPDEPNEFDRFLSSYKNGEDLSKFPITSLEAFDQLDVAIRGYSESYAAHLQTTGKRDAVAQGFIEEAGPAMGAISQILEHKNAVTSLISQDAIVSRVMFGTDEEVAKAYLEITSEVIYQEAERNLITLVQNGLIMPEDAEQMQDRFSSQLDSHLLKQSAPITPVQPTVSDEVVSSTPVSKTSAIEEDVINGVFQQQDTAVAISLGELSDDMGEINLTKEIADRNQALVLKLNIDGGQYLVTDNDGKIYPEIAARINTVEDLVLGDDKEFHTADGKEFKIDFLPTVAAQDKDFEFCISQFDPEPEKADVVSYLNANGVNAYEGDLVRQKQALEEAKQAELEAARMTEIARINVIIDEILKTPLISEICQKNGIDPQNLKDTKAVQTVLDSKIIARLQKYDGQKKLSPAIAEGFNELSSSLGTDFQREHKYYEAAQKADTGNLATFTETKEKFDALLANKYVAQGNKDLAKGILKAQRDELASIQSLTAIQSLEGFKTEVVVNSCLGQIDQLKTSLKYYGFDENVLDGLEVDLTKRNAQFQQSYATLEQQYKELGSSNDLDLDKKIARVKKLGSLNGSEQLKELLSYYEGSKSQETVQKLKSSITQNYEASAQDFKQSLKKDNGELVAEMNQIVERFSSSVSSIKDKRSIVTKNQAFGKQIDRFKTRFAEIAKSGGEFYGAEGFKTNYATPFETALDKHQQEFDILIEQRQQELNTPLRPVSQPTPSSLLGGSSLVHSASRQDHLPTPLRRRFDFRAATQEVSTDRGASGLGDQSQQVPRSAGRRFDFTSVAQQVSTDRGAGNRSQSISLMSSAESGQTTPRRTFNFRAATQEVSTDLGAGNRPQTNSLMSSAASGQTAPRRRFNFGPVTEQVSTERGAYGGQAWVDSLANREVGDKSPGRR